MEIKATFCLETYLWKSLEPVELEVELVGDYDPEEPESNAAEYCDLTGAAWKGVDLMPLFAALGIVDKLADHLRLEWLEAEKERSEDFMEEYDPRFDESSPFYYRSY